MESCLRILIITGDFGGEGRNPWLLDDLAVAFADAGDDVDVLAYDTKRGRAFGLNPYPDKRIRVFGAGPLKIRHGGTGNLLNYLAAGWRLHTHGFRMVRRRQYDLCIYTSIGILSWWLPARLQRAGIVRRTLFVLWDFFPIHQLQIGRIKHSALHAPLRLLEGLAMRSADAIAVMSPANQRYLHTYHPHVHVRTIIIVPPWASDPGPVASDGLHRRQRFTVVFGGQLVAGRGIDTLLRAARLLQDQAVPMECLIIGDGPERARLMAFAVDIGVTNTTFMGRLHREEYRNVLQSAHVGIAITVPGVTPPTFPSKIGEYCASGIPVIVCVEETSDAGKIVEASGAGIGVLAGDDTRLAAAMETLYLEHLRGELSSRADMARALFDTVLSVKQAAEKIRSVAQER